jgi:hypothetical protein
MALSAESSKMTLFHHNRQPARTGWANDRLMGEPLGGNPNQELWNSYEPTMASW